MVNFIEEAIFICVMIHISDKIFNTIFTDKFVYASNIISIANTFIITSSTKTNIINSRNLNTKV